VIQRITHKKVYLSVCLNNIEVLVLQMYYMMEKMSFARYKIPVDIK